MPQQPSPPYLFGATTFPRQLDQWDDVNAQNGKLRRTQTYVVLNPFNLTVNWNGYSDIVGSYNYEANNNFSLDINPILNTNYALCISYRVGGVVTRYLLWDAVGSNFDQIITPYTGQTIKKNFRLEIWSTSQGNATEATGCNFYTSVLGGLDYRYGFDGPLVVDDGLVDDFFNINSPVTIPRPGNAFTEFLASPHIIVDPTQGVTTWKDVLGLYNLSYSSFAQTVLLVTGFNGSLAVQTQDFVNGYMNMQFTTSQIVMLVQFIAPYTVGNVFSTGPTGVTVSVVNVTGNLKLSAYGAVSTQNIPTIPIVLIADSINGTLVVLDPTTGGIIDTIVGAVVNPATGTTFIIGSGTTNNPTNPNTISTGGQPITTGGQPILSI